MSRIDFLLKDFGMPRIKPRFYRPIGKYPDANDEDYQPQQQSESVERLDVNLPEVNSWMGLPVFADLTISDPDDETLKIYLDTVLIEVSAKKNIVETPIQGLTGTFKEFVSNDDYQVIIRGGIFNKLQNEYPVEEVNKLIQLCGKKHALDVSSDFLSLFDIYHIVIFNYKILQKAGRQNSQLFEIKCKSDNTIQLKLDEES